MQRWGQNKLFAIFFDLPIFYKILIGNLVVLAVGGGTVLFLFLVPDQEWARGKWKIASVLLLGGFLIIAVLMNYLLLKIALLPLSSLKNTVEKVLGGDFHARAYIPLFGDPQTNQLTDVFNQMLDKIEVYTRTIEKERAHSSRLTGLVLSSQENERKRIARELHDETSQILATLIMGLETMHRNMPKNGQPQVGACAKCRGRVERLMNIAEQTIKEVHRLAFNLRPAVLDDIGLIQAVQWLLREHVDKSGIKTEFFVQGLEGRLRSELEIVAFRIIQEACTNVIKHAHATNVKVSIWVDDKLHFTVKDNGSGFSLEEVRSRNKEGQLGLFGMQERANLLDGKVEIESAQGKGTTVHAQFPLNIERLEG